MNYFMVILSTKRESIITVNQKVYKTLYVILRGIEKMKTNMRNYWLAVHGAVWRYWGRME